MSLLQRIRDAREHGDLRGAIDCIPYAVFLGLTAEIDGAGRLVCTLPPRPGLVGNPETGALHGGVVGAFLETVGGLEVIWRRESESLPRTVNITVDYLRAGRPVPTRATGIITKLGRRVANVRVEAWQEREDKPVAHGHIHLLVG
ncbi:MAG: PaaI family thioesterase [Rhodovibrionaceae bacterium]